MRTHSWFKFTMLPVFFVGLLQGCTKFEANPVPQAAVQPAPVVTLSNRTQETLVLPNGLEVLVISSPGFTKASAAMAVPVGSWSDPEEHQGLAHFLEHMLFLGTKEYPDAAEYGAVVAKNGGYTNAYTARTLTNYLFEVNTVALPEVLRRFSRFFVSPTLDPKYIDKEKNAVHSEFDKNIRSDGWRFWQMFGLTEPTGHPARKFNIGSRTTLANADSEVLRRFYEKYYSSDTMKLVVIGSQPIAELRAMVESNFKDVPNRKLKGTPSDLVLPKSQAGQWMEIKSIGNKDELSLLFPSTSYDLHWQSKPGSMLAGLIGSEHAGSLASILKRKQWINRLSAGSQDLADGQDAGYFSISMELTEKGRAEKDEVLKTVFSVLGQIQKTGVKNYLFTEKQTMARLAFENRGLVDGADEASRISALMLLHPGLQVDERSMLFSASDEALYAKFLSTLTPDNVTVIAQFPEAQVGTIEPIYGTEYSVRSISADMKKTWNQALATQESVYKYPAPNAFIPTSFVLHKTEASKSPRVISDDTQGKIWFQQESGPETKPIGFASLRIWTPEMAKSPRKFLLARIYAKAFEVTQTERLSPLLEAGYAAGLSVGSSYVQLTVQGYSEKFADVLYDLLDSPTAGLNSISISDDDLVKIKGDLKKEFADYKVQSAINRAVAKKRYIVVSPSYEIEDYEGLLDSVTTTEVNAFAKELYTRVYVDGLVYGNLLSDPLKSLVPRAVKNLKAKLLTPEERALLEKKETLLMPSQKFVTAFGGADNNNAMIVQIDTGVRTHAGAAVNTMVGNLLKDRYYNEMRTNQQLGYIVQGGASASKVATRLDFYIQSADYQPEELSKRNAAFLASLLSEFDKVLDEKFEETRNGLILELSREPSVMAERFQRFTELWMERDADWSYDQSLIGELGKLGRDDVKAHAVKSLTPETQARLSIYYYGTKSTVPANFGEDVPVTSKSEFERLAKEVK